MCSGVVSAGRDNEAVEGLLGVGDLEKKDAKGFPNLDETGTAFTPGRGGRGGLTGGGGRDGRGRDVAIVEMFN